MAEERQYRGLVKHVNVPDPYPVQPEQRGPDTSGWGECVLEDEVLRQGFVQVPVQVFRDPKLNGGAVRVYGAILYHAWKYDGLVPGQEELGEWCGVTRKAVNEAMALLKKSGYITTKQVGLGRPNRITIRRLGHAEGQDSQK